MDRLNEMALTHGIFYRTLGPGAEIILSRLSFDPSIDVGNLTVEQVDEVACKFDQWPLRPRVLFEFDFD